MEHTQGGPDGGGVQMEGGVQMDPASQEVHENIWFPLLFRILGRDHAAREIGLEPLKGGGGPDGGGSR